jgi:hypothetical protein
MSTNTHIHTHKGTGVKALKNTKSWKTSMSSNSRSIIFFFVLNLGEILSCKLEIKWKTAEMFSLHITSMK